MFECENEQHENAARFEPPTVSIDETYHGITAEPVSKSWNSDIVDGSVLPGPHSNEQHSSVRPSEISLSSSSSKTAICSSPTIVNLPDPSLRLLPTEPVPCSSLNTNNNTIEHQSFSSISLPINSSNSDNDQSNAETQCKASRRASSGLGKTFPFVIYPSLELNACTVYNIPFR